MACHSEAFSDHVREKVVHGNRSGVELLQERDRISSRFDKLEKEVRNIRVDKDQEIGSLKAEVTSLQGRMTQLSAQSEGYSTIRGSFLDTFRRDILQDPSATFTEAINAGGIAAHDGDALIDATLSVSGRRTGSDSMLHIYGLSAEDVITLRKYLSPSYRTSPR